MYHVPAASVGKLILADKIMEDIMSDTSKRGFASMDPQKQHDIASKGGQSVPAKKRSFSQDHALAAEAGSKGGQSVSEEKRSFSQDHDLASAAGRKGGAASHGSKDKA
jgi:general stress protein YciG